MQSTDLTPDLIEKIPTENAVLRLLATHMLSNVILLRDKLQDFARQIEENPYYALSWSTGAFANAAALRINVECADLLADVLQGKTTRLTLDTYRDAVVRDLTRRVAHKAESVEASTSPVSNLLSRYDLAETARLLERFAVDF